METRLFSARVLTASKSNSWNSSFKIVELKQSTDFCTTIVIYNRLCKPSEKAIQTSINMIHTLSKQNPNPISKMCKKRITTHHYWCGHEIKEETIEHCSRSRQKKKCEVTTEHEDSFTENQQLCPACLEAEKAVQLELSTFNLDIEDIEDTEDRSEEKGEVEEEGYRSDESNQTVTQTSLKESK